MVRSEGMLSFYNDCGDYSIMIRICCVCGYGLLGAFSGKAVDGFFLAEHFPAENIIGKNSDGGEEKPQHREKQAYLTEKVERQLFVVPYLPIEPEVDYTAAEEFEGGDYKR